MNKKLSIPQILFTAFFVATLTTVSDSFIEWGKPIYHGIYAGILFIVGVVIAKMLFKDK
jgi:intracellular septation protein A